MKIITAGTAYLDIDAYAGIIAYAELLQKQGREAEAVSTAPPNESVPKTVRSWAVPLKTDYAPRPDDTFVLVDISTPDYFDSFVDLGHVVEVIDHHPGYEQYWHERIGEGADIEPIGSVCTQIFERWQRAGLESEISETSARLLVCGILDNTLNFGAKITTARDKAAYEQLLTWANLSEDWAAQYFGECQVAIDADPVQAVANDTKFIQFAGSESTTCVGQIAVWSAKELLEKSQTDIVRHFEAKNMPWFMNIISIGERKSYFLAVNPDVQQRLAHLLGVKFDGSLGEADRLWLRKEIIQAVIDRAGVE